MFKTKFLLAASIMIISLTSQAIEINSLFNIADEQGSAVFTIKNTDNKRLFLNVGMSKLNVENGDVVKEVYTRNNINEWEFDVRPARTIIDVGQSKEFKVSLRCKSDCKVSKDQAYQVAFIPTPYFDANSKPDSAVQIAVGFGATFLNAGKDKPIKYKAFYQGDSVVIINEGTTYFKAFLDNCAKGTKPENIHSCKASLNVLPGRKLVTRLKGTMLKPYVNLVVKSNLDKYSDEVKLKREE